MLLAAVCMGQANEQMGINDHASAVVLTGGTGIGPNWVAVTARHCGNYAREVKRGHLFRQRTISEIDQAACNADPATVYYHSLQHNLKTYGGGDFIANVMGTNSAQPASAQYFAVSSDSTAPAATDSTLTSEIVGSGLARHAATYSHSSCSGFPCTYTLSYTWTFTAVVTNVQKGGIFNASSGGTMVFEAAFSPVTGAINDTLQFQWIITIN